MFSALHNSMTKSWSTFLNVKNHSIAQESSRYSVRNQDKLFLLFVYIKILWQKKWFCIWMKIRMTAIIERQRARLYTQKAKQLPNVFIYKKPDTFQKTRQFPLRFIYKKPYAWRYGIFMKFLMLVYIYKKHDTLRYVTFLHKKS